MEGTPIFSPDSKRLAYAVPEGNKWFVVVDGKEGKQYRSLLGTFGEEVSNHFSKEVRHEKISHANRFFPWGRIHRGFHDLTKM